MGEYGGSLQGVGYELPSGGRARRGMCTVDGPVCWSCLFANVWQRGCVRFRGAVRQPHRANVHVQRRLGKSRVDVNLGNVNR